MGPPKRDKEAERRAAIEAFEAWSPTRGDIFENAKLSDRERDALMVLYANDPEGIDSWLSL